MQPADAAATIAEKYTSAPGAIRTALAAAILEAIEEDRREAQTWRPISVRATDGRIAEVQLHCTDEGTEIVAYNPISNEVMVISLAPRKKPASEQRERKAELA
jgi:hypothetical protein